MSPPPEPFGPPRRAWVRDVSDAYADCIRSGTDDIDVALARHQHAAYVRALEVAGIEVRHVSADHPAPDACFIEDTAVVVGESALLTRPGAPTRERETGPVGSALAEALDVEKMTAPGNLDGGDVLRVGAQLLVGTSSRTNDAGVEALRDFAARRELTVLPVAVRSGLHLKSAVTLLSPGVLLLADTGALRAEDLGHNLDVITVAEPHGANVLALGATVLVSAAAPKTSRLIRERGFRVMDLDISELHRGDGALTCLSLRQPQPHGWCA